MKELKTLKDLNFGDNPDWECSNCESLNDSDNPFCRDCDKENYDREEMKKEIKEELKEELKTLKDLPKIDCGCNGEDFCPYCRVDVSELRAEAVKWVKQWRDLRYFNKIPSPKLPSSLKEQADDIMMSFFNLTEEDLK